ncbi:hypothetical protein BGX29_011939 [Mortierella sp. GBA35]|nr:hypothetical protein BGX29_011939 [Mortierella sp. GBA35]
MSNFNPPPDNGLDNCRGLCKRGEECFLYATGTLCQPFTAPATYPPPDSSNTTTVVNPPGWYIARRYPSLRYTGSLTNQTQGANCTTVPIPQNPLYADVANYIIDVDLGYKFTTIIDSSYSSTLMQFRGNCAEDFYCQPTAAFNITPIITASDRVTAQGSLPGTCQPLRAVGQPCQSSTMCRQWHLSSDGSYDNDQNRCQGSSPTTGTCNSLNVGKGNIYSDNSTSYLQRSARVYLLASLFLFVLIFVYMWYRRQKSRQLQMQYYTETGIHPSEHPAMYSRRGGVNRRPDDNDNGELPSYGMHRRDERVTGPAAEEIGMYSFPSGTPGGPPGTPGAPGTVPYTSYPYPATHPALVNPYPPAPPGALYPPPQTPPPPTMTPQQAEAAGLAAALTTPSPAATNLREGGPLPPSYDSTAVPTSQPSLTPGNNTTNAAGAAAGAGGEEKPRSYNPFLASSENSPRGSYVGAEKSAFDEEQQEREDVIPDQASASSGSGSGTGRTTTATTTGAATATTKPSSNNINKETK